MRASVCRARVASSGSGGRSGGGGGRCRAGCRSSRRCGDRGWGRWGSRIRGSIRLCLAARSGFSATRRLGAAPISEVGYIPARTFELKSCCSDLLLKLRLATRWAIGQHRIGNLLQHVLGKSTGLAAIGVYRHSGDISQRGVPESAKPAIIGRAPLKQPSYRKRNQTMTATPRVPITKPTAM